MPPYQFLLQPLPIFSNQYPAFSHINCSTSLVWFQQNIVSPKIFITLSYTALVPRVHCWGLHSLLCTSNQNLDVYTTKKMTNNVWSTWNDIKNTIIFSLLPTPNIIPPQHGSNKIIILQIKNRKHTTSYNKHYILELSNWLAWVGLTYYIKENISFLHSIFLLYSFNNCFL